IQGRTIHRSWNEESKEALDSSPLPPGQFVIRIYTPHTDQVTIYQITKLSIIRFLNYWPRSLLYFLSPFSSHAFIYQFKMCLLECATRLWSAIPRVLYLPMKS